MKAFDAKYMILLAFALLAGCAKPLMLPPNADPVYCHLNADFVRHGYYPPPTSLPANSAVLGNANTGYSPPTYAYPQRVGTGPRLAPR